MFYVGQEVICIDINIRPETTYPQILNKLKMGNIYHIAKIGLCGAGVQLAEIQTAHENNYFFSNRFRPIVKRETDISIFKGLLKSSKIKDLCGND